MLDDNEQMCYTWLMHRTESVIIKVAQPNKRKAQWLAGMASMFSQAVQLGLDAAQAAHTASRNKLHQAVYYPARELGLPGDYARMAVNAAVTLARSYYGLRKTQQCPAFPKVHGSQGLGLGVASYKVVQDNARFVLRVSTGARGQYLWLPLCVPARYRDSIASAQGDARLFKRRGQWYVMLPVRIHHTPAGCSGARTFIGVDLGVVRHATVQTPDRTVFFAGRAPCSRALCRPAPALPGAPAHRPGAGPARQGTALDG